MKKWMLVSLALILFVLVGLLAYSQRYYEAGPNFEHMIYYLDAESGRRDVSRLTGNDIVITKYMEQELIDSVPFPYTRYYFETLDTGESVVLQIPCGVADGIKLVPDTVYRVISEIKDEGLWGLIIYQDTEFIFAGITDHPDYGWVTIDDSFSQVKAEQTRILTNHYITSSGDDDECWDRITNTEITFSLNGDSVTLHQGQSAVLGDYGINLMIARDVQYTNRCVDFGFHAMSYTISRASEFTPPETSETD